jgi:hypothetical protein
MTVLRIMLVAALGLSAGARAGVSQTLAARQVVFFSFDLPTTTSVHRERGSPRELLRVALRDSIQLPNLEIVVGLLPKDTSLAGWARAAYLEDSTQSAANDWGRPGRLRHVHLGRLDAWEFEPTCGDCRSFATFAARGDTLVIVTRIFDDRLSRTQVARLERLYARVLASFRWRGA